MIDKLKNTQRIGRKTFLFAWIGTGILAFTIESVLLYADLVNIVSFSVSIGTLTYIHQWLLRRAFGIFIRRWWLFSMVAWIIGYGIAGEFAKFLGSQLFIMNDFSRNMLLGLVFMIFFGFPGLMQSYLLRPHFKHVGLFAMLLLISGGFIRSLIHNLPSVWTPELFFFVSVVLNETIFYAAVTGLTLLWLDRITNTKEKNNIAND